DRNREDCADATVRDGHSTHRPDVEAEPAIHPCQLSRVSWQPLHDPQTGIAEVHPAVSPARILQRRTVVYTAGPAGDEEPPHHPHTRRGRCPDRRRGIDKPLQPDPYP